MQATPQTGATVTTPWNAEWSLNNSEAPQRELEGLLFQQSGANTIMTIVLENRQLFAEKTITAPYPMGFAELVAFIRSVEPDRAWQIAEYG
jgi:hypothetical protein